MKRLNDKTIEKMYAGWLGKLIGIRSGAPIEMWTAEQIAEKYGEIDGYPVDYKNFGADDDSNGNIFSLQTFFDYDATRLTSVDFGRTILNYAAFEHGYFSWCGYGVSEEHTAYLNMKNGIMPPASGSIQLNGKDLAEQIGGQIFSDIYGLVCPGDYRRAADLAEAAARVTHDGEAVFGGRFVAACISAAFYARSVADMIQTGLTVIPENSKYAQTVRAVLDFHAKNPTDHKACLAFIRQHYWRDKYGGSCHIIPNIAIMILSLAYGEGDFDKSVNLCNMCGFDTDCNTSNIAVMLGVLLGLKAIDYVKWRLPINDITVASSVMGSMNLLTAPQFVSRLYRTALMLLQEEAGNGLAEFLADERLKHFELPGSTHGFIGVNADLYNTEEKAYTGKRSLKIVPAGANAKVYFKTYYRADEMYDSRYDPAFSPLVFPGQTIRLYVCADAETDICLYIRDANSDKILPGAAVRAGEIWQEITYAIPPDDTGMLVSEIGLMPGNNGATVYIDDVTVSGKPSYLLDFRNERIEYYWIKHQEVSQCTHHSGYWRLEAGALVGSCADKGELYTGGMFEDVTLSCRFMPVCGRVHMVLFGVQGASRAYGAGFREGRFVLEKKTDDVWKTLFSVDYPWQHHTDYQVTIENLKGKITVSVNGRLLVLIQDPQGYGPGQIGAAIEKGSCCRYYDFKVNERRK